MEESPRSRRQFLKTTTLAAGAALISRMAEAHEGDVPAMARRQASETAPVDYTIRIETSPIEIAPKRIISVTTYNGQFPGPLLRFKEGQPVTVEIINETDVPEQLHWHGQKVSTEVDGAAEEGTPWIPAHGKWRISFTPSPSGLRFYHTHNRAGADLLRGSMAAK